MTRADATTRLVDAFRRLNHSQPVMIYPNAYVWLVFVSAMDLMLTWLIISLGGSEVNPLANRILDTSGHMGLVGFKFGIVIAVVLVCEYIGRREIRKGRFLGWTAVGLSAIPIFWSLSLLLSTSLGYFFESLFG